MGSYNHFGAFDVTYNGDSRMTKVGGTAGPRKK